MKWPHCGLVLSGKAFNQRGLAMICPISQGAAVADRAQILDEALHGSRRSHSARLLFSVAGSRSEFLIGKDAYA